MWSYGLYIFILNNIKFSCKLFLFTHCITTTLKIPIYLYDTISMFTFTSQRKQTRNIYSLARNKWYTSYNKLSNKRVESCHQFLRSHWLLSPATGTRQSPAPPNFFLVATCIIFASAWTFALINADAEADADVQINADVPHLRMQMRMFATSLEPTNSLCE